MPEIEGSATTLYEIGYLLVPTLTSESLLACARDVTSAIESAGGVLVSDGQPVERDLAYEVAHTTASSRNKYKKAYFGWVKFEADAEVPTALKKVIEGNSMIMRFMIMKASRAVNQTVPIRLPTLHRPEGPVEKKESITPEQIDKEIEQLLTVPEKV
jgi:ribosomal protein S6